MEEATTAPLLSPSTIPPDQNHHTTDTNTKKSLDDTIEQCLGGFGLWQSLQAILVSFAWVFDAQQTFISIFTDAPASWYCTTTNSTSCSLDRCLLPNDAWQWERPAHTSVVSEWGLDCLGPAVVGLPAFTFFTGCVVGGFLLSTIADSYLGRKRMLFLNCLAMSLAGTLTPFSPNVWVYAAFRFVTGFCRATIGTSSLVLSMEIVGRHQRGQVAIIGFFCFTLGFLSLPVIAYPCRESSWRYLYLWTSVPGMAYSILAYSFVMESPRWLAVRGRREEAIQTLKSMAVLNGHAEVIYSSFSGVPVCEGDQARGGIFGAFYSLKTLTERWWSLKRLLYVMTMGFGLGLLYYGMPLAVGDLGANLYWSVAINALAEFPSSVATSLLVHKINRRATAVAFTWASCALSLACVANAGRMAAEVAAFFCTCTAYNVVMIYGMELFPTCVRNSALSMLRQAVVMGGAMAPVLVAAGREGKGRLTFGLFGAAIGCCGSFALLLPETRGEVICDTMEEQEWRDQMKRERLPVLC